MGWLQSGYTYNERFTSSRLHLHLVKPPLRLTGEFTRPILTGGFPRIAQALMVADDDCGPALL